MDALVGADDWMALERPGRVGSQRHSLDAHPASKEMRYRRPADPSLGALVRMFVANEGNQRVDLHPSQGFLFVESLIRHWWIQRVDLV